METLQLVHFPVVFYCHSNFSLVLFLHGVMALPHLLEVRDGHLDFLRKQNLNRSDTHYLQRGQGTELSCEVFQNVLPRCCTQEIG